MSQICKDFFKLLFWKTKFCHRKFNQAVVADGGPMS
eukprot:CAMPEP_0172735594 /NCGR_PEP_ID=MMETSP1074-20121228/112895_1 /TAXON_ID=2916 /ORGANISM="Ceratium fusus, Strain PA161109" /LENGTH=35 /DNA_ID= /DNA_START= /DNA_END= /DNA_ORIENTATION=